MFNVVCFRTVLPACQLSVTCLVNYSTCHSVSTSQGQFVPMQEARKYGYIHFSPRLWTDVIAEPQVPTSLSQGKETPVTNE